MNSSVLAQNTLEIELHKDIPMPLKSENKDLNKEDNGTKKKGGGEGDRQTDRDDKDKWTRSREIISTYPGDFWVGTCG